ncbi:MAG: cytochrome c3 family protein [Nitrospirae bacterium]|nr:cytochrome c3 family protein [Nitrospirota bacterium]
MPLAFSLLFCLSPAVIFAAQKSDCVECHRKVTPGIVQQHLQGKMAKAGVDCSACHGSEHKKADDSKLARLPTPGTCAGCHKKQADQFKSGKHIGRNDMNSPESMRYGNAQCDACHSRHLFSKLEAQNPNVCRACHALQWEIWSTSRHGIIWQIEGKWSKRVPACRTCHMPDGDHSVMVTPGKMVRTCTKCHGAGYVKKMLDVECRMLN